MTFTSVRHRLRRQVVFALIGTVAAAAATWSAGGGPLVGRTSSGVNVAGHYIPIDPAGYLYITNLTQTNNGVTTDGNTVTVLRESSNDVVTNLAVGRAPKGIDVSFNGPGTAPGATENSQSDLNADEDDENQDPAPDPSRRGFVYVANSGDNTLSVLNDYANPASDTNAWTAPVGRSPWGVGVDQLKSIVAVSNNGDSSVTFLDGSENARLGTVMLPVVNGKLANPQQVAVDQKSETVYVSNPGNGTVTAINMVTRRVVASISVPGTPVYDAADNKGHIFVASTNGGGAGLLSAIDTATNTVLPASASTGAAPFAVAVNPVNGQVDVTNNGDNTLGQYSFNGVTFARTGTLALPPDPKGVAFTDDGQSAYAVSQKTGTVTQVTPAGAVTASDRVPPTTAVNSGRGYYGPGATVNGTATDDASGVGTVQVGYTTAGSAIAPSSTTDATLSCSNTSNRICTWTASLPTPDGNYKVWARAIDRNRDSAGPNVGPWSTADDITADRTAPVVTITSPASTSVLVPGQTQVAGTATDNLSGFGTVVVTFTATTLGTNTQEAAALACDSGRNSCSWSVTTPAALSPGTYNVQATATDRAGNQGQSNVVVFTVGL